MPQSVLHVWVGCGLLVTVGACSGSADAPAAQPPAAQAPVFQPVDAETVARQAMAPMERYAGVLPCADCSGIRTELTLHKDPVTREPRAYQLVETYLGSMSPGAERPVTTTGTWSETTGVPGDSVAPVVRLDGGGRADAARAFERLSTQELRLLDRQGARIASTLNYSLVRIPDLTLPAPPGAPMATPDAGAAMPMAMVTDRATGWPVTLRVGQKMTARMAMDPATGGRWVLRAGSDGGVVRVEGEPVMDGAGADAVAVFTMTAVKPGQATLAFDYMVAGASAPSRSATYPLTVQ